MGLIFLKIGLGLTAFYEISLKLLPYASVQTPDTRIAKIYLGMWLALALGLSAIYTGKIKECRNIWLLLFIAYIPLCIHLAPKFPIVMNGIDSTNYWMWKPFLIIVCYFLMFLYVQSMNITKKSLRGIFNVMTWCGFVMAIYVIVQSMGWDQFFQRKTGDAFRAVTKPLVVGTLGNSTIVSSFIAMIIPISLYLKRATAYRVKISRYVIIPVLILAVCLTHSEMAGGAMVVSLLVYLCLRWRAKGFFIIIVLLILCSSAGLIYKHHNPLVVKKISSQVFQDNGRFGVWKESIYTLKTEQIGKSKSRIPFTGYGPGSYAVIMKPLIKITFAQAHNEYIGVLIAFGWIGLFLFLASIGYMFRDIFRSYLHNINRAESSALISSFICIALVALGSFPWQLSPHGYYTVLIVGLLSNQFLLKEELT